MKGKTYLSLFSRTLALVIIGFLLNSATVRAQNRKESGEVAPEQFSHTETVAVLTRYQVKKGYRKIFRKAIRKYVRRAVAGKTNIMAEAYYEQENPSVLWIIERWSSQSGLERMRQGSTFKLLEVLSEKKLEQPVKTIRIKDLEPLSKSEWRRKPMKDDTPVTIMLFVECRAGTEDSFKEVYHTAMPQFRSEPGVINYQLSQFEDDSTQFVTYEKFRSEDGFQYHLKFPPIQPVIDYLNTSIRKQPFQTGLHRLIEFAPVNRR